MWSQANLRKEEVIYRTRSQLTVALLRIDGKPVDLTDYPMFTEIYDGGYRSVVLKTSRQIGKSTTLSNFSITESIAIPHFRTLFVSPTQEQTHKFSTERVGKTLTYSPIVKRYYMPPGTGDRVLVRSLKGGATIYFSYAKENADRCRGISADRMCLDEVQDINLEAVVPVVRETMANSDYGYEMFCGTPKSMENGIEGYWQNSSQTEWAIKCPGCGRHSIILSEKQLTHKGPICTKCKSLLNPRHGTWVDTTTKKYITKGFHISRPMMPKNVPACWPVGPLRDKAQSKWDDVMNKLEGPNASSITLFRNEVLGVSDSEGVRLLGRADLEAMCTGPQLEVIPKPQNVSGLQAIGVGIDWSGGGTEVKSRTVITIQGWRPDGRIRLLNYKIFPGTGPVQEMEEIVTLIKHYDRISPVFIVGDAGEGNMNMDTLRNKFTQPKRVMKVRYQGSQIAYVKYNAEAVCYMVNKTVAIDSMMSYLKVGSYEFPGNVAVMNPMFDDIMNEHVEISRDGKKRWTHANNKPDDALHALVFGRLALQLAMRQVDLGSSL